MLELAMAKDEVKARLAPIPVFTVANPKNEFVLVAGEVSTVSFCKANVICMVLVNEFVMHLVISPSHRRITHSWVSSSSSERTQKQ